MMLKGNSQSAWAVLVTLCCSAVGLAMGCRDDAASSADARPRDTAAHDARNDASSPTDLWLPGCEGLLPSHFPSYDIVCKGKPGCYRTVASHCFCSCTACEHGKCRQVTCDDSCLAPKCEVWALGKACAAATDCPNKLFSCLPTTDGGICACGCTPDDPATTLINEDSCPDLSKAECLAFTRDAGVVYYCVTTDS